MTTSTKPTSSDKRRISSNNPRKKASTGTKRPTPSKETKRKSLKPSTNEFDRESQIRAALHILLNRTKPSSTICPSQIPRQLHKEDSARYPDWRGMMDEVRDIVWKEVQEGRVEVTQGGEVRKYEEREEIKGPIRVRREPKWTD